MQRYLLTILTVLWGATGGPALANCLVIDQLDKVQTLSNRLWQNTDSRLFSTDIRQLRAITRDLSDRDVLAAIGGNTLLGLGPRFVDLMADTRSLLQSVSLDDPNSVRTHFTRARQQTLQTIANDLTDLRCTDEQVSAAHAEAAADLIKSTDDSPSDAEDMRKVSQTIARVAEEVLQLRSFFIVIGVLTAVMILAPVLKRWRHLRRRRAKRYNTSYVTLYQHEDTETDGTLIDVNCYGTKLRHAKNQPLEQGTTVAIRIGQDWRQGHVMWSNTHYSGVQFKPPVSLDDVDHICNPQL